ncbi:universal stress protein [Stenomitos frigidus]|uniref:Universal stress protein UspA-like protein n=1 Tax=Stenomitos frigidus ULC18 TaxID=2107698 RepID=A0A2T1ENP2_9CYAN|nr:universal stress protein [Stenomitos frigidus]PSB34354.1 universal stress protein UspA-like protein [Stenomitos frigidus ULC18]
MFQRLLICTDFSDGLQRLVNFVSSFAAGGIERLVFLHSIPFEDCEGVPRVDAKKIEHARDRLNVALNHDVTGIDVKVIVEPGRPVDLILKAAEEHAVDLIVVGTPTRSLLAEKLFGSTTIELSQRLTVPLMILRPQLIATYTSEELALRCRHLFRYLLVPYHGSDASKYLIQRLKESLQQPTIGLQQLHLCWVVEGMRRRDVPVDYQLEAAQRELEAIATELTALKIAVDPVEVREGDPIVEVLAAAQTADVSAIATTSSSLNKLLRWSVPQFTDELLRRSWHPIIYFPAGVKSSD